MIKPDIDVCRSISAKAGLPIDFVVKEFYLFNLMESVKNSTFSTKLIFKGGTALNTVYMDNLRFSEDLDFDLMQDVRHVDVRSYINQIMNVAEGFSSTETRKIRQTYMIDFIYTSPLGKKDRVRLDIKTNMIHLSAKSPISSVMRSKITGQNISGILVYGFEDLLARKMNALASRMEGKDVFDVANSIKKANLKLLKKAIKYSLKEDLNAIEVDSFLEGMMQKLSNNNYSSMMKLTNPYIPIALRPKNWRILAVDLINNINELKNV